MITPTSTRAVRRGALAFSIDASAVLVFVAVGRRSHDESGNAVVGVGRVALPFLLALALAWVVLRARREPLAVRTGAAVWIVTVAVGLAMRRFLFDRSTAASFMVVTALVLGVLLVGWRGAPRRIRRR